MGRYLVARAGAIVPTILLLLLFVVVLVRILPGDVVDALFSDNTTAEQRAQIRDELGLDRNIVDDYLRYSGHVFEGDLGQSLVGKSSVSALIRDRATVTLELSLFALIFALVLGIPIGVISAIVPNSPTDYALRTVSILGLSIPTFSLATMWVVLPVVWWGWSPSIIYVPVSDGLVPHLGQFVAPGLILGIALSATLMRITRTMMLEVMRQDYVRTARAKGLAGRTVVLRHALRNAMIPVISLLGTQIAVLISGTIVTELVFGLPGLGRTLINSIQQRDYPVIQGITVVTGLAVILINLAVDASYGFIDPRTRVSGG